MLLRTVPAVAWIVGVGASTGFGAAAARRFARGGLSVALTGGTLEHLEAVATEIRAVGGRACVLPGDIAQESQVRTLAADLAGLGPLRASVLNADSVVQGQPWASTLFAREAVKALLAHDADVESGGTRGSVLFSATGASMSTELRLRKLVRRLANEYEPQGIHVGLVPFGAVDGRPSAGLMAEALWQLHIQRRVAWTAEVAPIARRQRGGRAA